MSKAVQDSRGASDSLGVNSFFLPPSTSARWRRSRCQRDFRSDSLRRTHRGDDKARANVVRALRHEADALEDRDGSLGGELQEAV